MVNFLRCSHFALQVSNEHTHPADGGETWQCHGCHWKKSYLPELSKRYMSNTQNILLTALIIRIKEVILLPCCLPAFNLCYQNVKTEKD